MRVSIEWLKQYLEIEQAPEELAEILTRGGIEVEGVEYLNKGIKNIIIGEIKAIKPHPNAQKLQVCNVNIGSEELIIVTGADNIQLGDKVPVAVPGAKLPGDKLIEPTDLRGVMSHGMLCSDKELGLEFVGLDRSKGGILILLPDAEVGSKLEDYLGLDNNVLELELYPNRPDCMSMINVAREVGTLLGLKPKFADWLETNTPLWPTDVKQKIEIENPELSWRYSALLVEDVVIRPSPRWMRNRLRAAGIRPINNIVDITNYCMLETGQPLHAFDMDKLKGTVRVRLAREGEKLVTLDGVERQLDNSMLVIADDSGPIALAGVMGGLDTEVTASTKRIFFESAHFAGASIRRTGRKLGMRSESSSRFEKGVDPHGTVTTLARVAELLLELEAGVPMSFTEHSVFLPPQAVIELSPERVNNLLGVDYSRPEIEQVFEALNFEYECKPDGKYVVYIPSYRQDLKIEEDMIEEIARIIGYNRIPTTLPLGSQTQGRRTPEQEFRRKVRHTLLEAGMNEIITYSFTKKESDDIWGRRDMNIPILNPLREELGVMRTSLLPGLLETAARNAARRNLDLLLFEIGSVYWPTKLPLTTLPQEKTLIAGLVQGQTQRHWLVPQIKFDFYFLKGILSQLEMACGVKFTYTRLNNSRYQELLHPGRSAEITVAGEYLGFMGEIFPQLDEEWGLNRPVLFELDFDVLYRNCQTTLVAKSYPRFPAIQRDLALVVPQDIPSEAIKNRILELGGELLQTVEIFDVYQGQPVEEGHKSVAFSLRYQSPERTLKDEEVISLNSNILATVQQEFGAQWRK